MFCFIYLFIFNGLLVIVKIRIDKFFIKFNYIVPEEVGHVSSLAS